MIQFDAKVVNVQELRADLIRMLAQLGPKAEEGFLRAAGKVAQRRIRQSLAQGGPGWAPLATTTIERRRRMGKGVTKHRSGKFSTHEKRAYERLLYGGLTAREAKKAGTWFEPPDDGAWTTTSEKFNRARFSPLPLGGPQGTFSKAIRVKLDKRQGSAYIGPPDRNMGTTKKKSLYELFKIHKRGGPGLPARELQYLRPEDIKRIEQIAEAMIDRALKIVKGGKGGRVSNFFRTDLTR